jgi:hypothetical protein
LVVAAKARDEDDREE